MPIFLAKAIAIVYYLDVKILQKLVISIFYRKISEQVIQHLQSVTGKILVIDGARQVGKSFIIRHVCRNLYKNYIEINMLEDKNGPGLFHNVNSTEEFYLQLSIAAGGQLGARDDTLVFIDKIQAYPQLLTLLKFLNSDGKYTYVASGSMLGIALKKTVSIPMGSISVLHMYPMDFEEFLLASGIGNDVIEKLRECFVKRTSPPSGVHEKILRLFKYYLISGGLPDAVKAFVEERNISKMRSIQLQTHEYYSVDASQYDTEHNLKIKSVYNVIPSLMENRKKRIVAKDIENKKGKTFEAYSDEFDYLVSSGVALDVKAVPTPVFPLTQGLTKNLIKLYLNDPGILSAVLYGNNINSLLDDELSINLGSIYETVVASELKAHGFELYYYDNRKNGEVDFLIDDCSTQSVLPIEVKSGKDYSIHASLDRFITNADCSVSEAYVLSNSGEIVQDGKITYYPVYMCMFIEKNPPVQDLLEPVVISEWK